MPSVDWEGDIRPSGSRVCKLQTVRVEASRRATTTVACRIECFVDMIAATEQPCVAAVGQQLPCVVLHLQPGLRLCKGHTTSSSDFIRLLGGHG